MGINLLSFDGMVIMRAKRFVLECYACKRICKNPTKKFCPTCGNATMTKLSCSINSDGTIQFYRKKNFKINTRGAIVFL
jgi:RNA-binding protein NOB1